jgi:hypothetical protein
MDLKMFKSHALSMTASLELHLNNLTFTNRATVCYIDKHSILVLN